MTIETVLYLVHRDNMFIENEIIHLFSSVGAECEIKRYKHSAPTKSTPNARMAFGGAKELGGASVAINIASLRD